MSILAVLIDLAHTYISHEAKKRETWGNAKKCRVILFSEEIADASDVLNVII